MLFRSSSHNPLLEDSRDVWIAHRRRVKDNDSSDDGGSGHDDDDASCWETTIESLLKRQNGNRVDKTPLAPRSRRGRRDYSDKNHAVAVPVSNGNLKAVFGSKPPVRTAFVTEDEVYELFRNRLDGSSPASVLLLQRYNECRIGGYSNSSHDYIPTAPTF